MNYCPKCGEESFSRDTDKPYRLVCSACGYLEYENPAPAVAALVQFEEKMIVVQYKDRPHLWGLPGGFVESGESLEVALIREVKEETGLDVEITSYLNSYPTTRHEKPVVFMVFTATSRSDSIQMGEEHLQVLFLPYQEAYERLTGKYSKQALGEWLSKHNT